MQDDIIKNICSKMNITLTNPEVGVGFIMLPPLLTDYAKQMLDEKRGMFKREKKMVYNKLCNEIHKYFKGLFVGMDIDQQCIICDMQDGMAEYIKKHVDNLHYSLQSAMMHIPAEDRIQICDFIVIKAIIETSNLVVRHIIKRNDENLYSAYNLSRKMLELLYKPYYKGENIDLNKHKMVVDASEVFIAKLLEYQKIKQS